MVGGLTCNEGKIRSFISGEQSQILRGRGKQRQYFGTGNIFSIFGGRGTSQFISFFFLSLYTARPSFEYYRKVYFVHSGLQDESLQGTRVRVPPFTPPHALRRPHRSIIYEYGTGSAPVCYLKSIYAVVYCIPDSNM